MVEADNLQGIDGKTRQASNRTVIPRHISALDGLRAFAILAVMFHHYGEYYLMPIRRLVTPASLWKAWAGGLTFFSSFRIPDHRDSARCAMEALFFPAILLATRTAHLATLLPFSCWHATGSPTAFSRIGVAPFVFYYETSSGRTGPLTSTSDSSGACASKSNSTSFGPSCFLSCRSNCGCG